MAALLTLDASVFVAAYRTQEGDSAVSRDILRFIREWGVPLIEPAILPVEIAAALAHAGENSARAAEYAEGVLNFPYLSLDPLDMHAARRALVIAAQCRLRGADALYVAAAVQYGARLVTLDAEQLRRAPAAVSACNPDAAARLLKR